MFGTSVLIAAIENFVLFSTLLALGMFLLTFAVRQLISRNLWASRPDNLARLYTGALVIPPVGSLWLVTSAFLPLLWLTPEGFEAAHPAPYHQLHLFGELTVALEPALSYALVLFAGVSVAFALWFNVLGSWRLGRLINRLDMNAAASPPAQVGLVNDMAAEGGLDVGLVMSDYPFSFVWGFRRSKLVLSSGLLLTLTPQELEGVLDHEVAHHARRDNLLKLMLTVCSYTSLVFPLARLISRWRAAEVEIICDEVAAAQTESPLEIAEALVKLRRQTMSVKTRSEPAASVAVASGFVCDGTRTFQRRVSHLLALVDAQSDGSSPRTKPPAAKSTLMLTAAIVTTLLALPVFEPLFVHHTVEALIQIFK